MNKRKHLQRQALGLLAGYAIQFLAGMALNLFATIPAQHPGADGKEYFSSSSHGFIWALSGHGGAALAIHVYIALALMLGSIGLLITSIRLQDTLWTWCSGIAAFFTVGAFFNGLSFIDYSHDISSMIMASCWLVAVGAIIYALVAAKDFATSRQ